MCEAVQQKRNVGQISVRRRECRGKGEVYWQDVALFVKYRLCVVYKGCGVKAAYPATGVQLCNGGVSRGCSVQWEGRSMATRGNMLEATYTSIAPVGRYSVGLMQPWLTITTPPEAP